MLISVRGAAPGVTKLSTMIAVRPRPDEAQALHPADPADLHCTLCFLGDYDGDLTDLAGCLAQVGAGHAPLEGSVSGVGVFADNGDGYPQILLPSALGLTELRVAVTQALTQAGVDYSRRFGFHPHMTVGYSETPDPPGTEMVGAPLHFDAVCIVRGNVEEMQVPLTGVRPLTAAAIVATTDKGEEIGAVAEAHSEGCLPDYGDCYWHAADGKVFWIVADYTTNDQIDAGVAAFEEVDGVQNVEACDECAAPAGEGWERVYGYSARSAQERSEHRAGVEPALTPQNPGESLLRAPRSTLATRWQPARALRASVPVTAQYHTRVVEVAHERTEELEPRLAAILEPILNEAGNEAARTFTAMTTVTAAAKWSPPAGDELIDVPALAAKLRTKTDPVRLATIKSTMDATLEPHGLSFDVTNPFTAEVLAQSGSQVTAIAETTRANVMRSVREAYDQGLSVPDTAKLIRAGMRDASPSRATLIARTELAGAVNGGSLAATRIVEEEIGVAFNKQWLTAPGAIYPRHELYEGLNGQTTTLDGTFDVGGYDLGFPGDPDGPPEEVCNCRCALAYVEASSSPQSGPSDEASAPPSVYEGGSITTDDPFGVDELAVLNAHGENTDLDADYMAMHDRLQRQISEADWSKAPPGAEVEANEAAIRVGTDTIKTLTDEQGRLLGIVDFNIPADVGEIEVAIEGVTEDLAAADPADRDYLQQILNELEKRLAQSLNPDAVVGVNHLASTGIENGIGARLMKEVAREASARGRGVGLNSLDSARGFYERLGMTERTPGDFYWTPEEARQFAEGKALGAPGVAGPMITDGPATSYLDDLQAEWGKTLTLQDKQALGAWKLDEGYRKINAFARAGTGGDVVYGKRTVEQLAENLDRVIASAPAITRGVETVVFRGVKDIRKVLGPNVRVGTRITEKGFQSVTTEEGVAFDYATPTGAEEGMAGIIKIELPEGSQGAWLRAAGVEDTHGGSEYYAIGENHEMLLPRNQEFEVVSVTRKDGYPVVTMRPVRAEVPPPPAPSPLLPPSPDQQLLSLVEQAEARPKAHLTEGTLSTQTARTRKLLRELLAKEATTGLTPKEIERLSYHEEKLRQLLREKEIRSGTPQREFAHWTNEHLDREVFAQREAINLARLAGTDPTNLAAGNERLRALTKEQDYRLKHPKARIREADTLTPAATVLPPPSNERVARLRVAAQSFGERMQNAGGLADPLASFAELKAAEQEITALGADIRDEMYTRIPYGMGHSPELRRKAFSEVMAEIRPMGKIDPSASGFKKITGSAAVEPDIEKALGFFPQEWVARAKTQTLRLKVTDRGYFREGDERYNEPHEISVSTAFGGVPGDSSQFSVALHETAHLMEHNVPAIRAAESAFYARRTEGDFVRRLPGKQKEFYRQDEWTHPYMGRDYGVTGYDVGAVGSTPYRGQFFEILSTGMEGLLTGRYVLDEDMTNFLLGLLASA